MKGIIICYDVNNIETKKMSMLKLPIKEEKIIKESTKLYDEADPCIIYRTIVINRVGLNLLNKFKELDIKDKVLSLEELESLTDGILDMPEEVKSVKFI